MLAQILCGLGLKPSTKIVETSGLKLTGQYLGHTKIEVYKHLKEAKGGVLFIDEAYNLGEGQYGKEACDTLVEAMTSDDFSDVTIVIAGYTFEINEMLKSNAGLKSRFTEFLNFPDWDAEDCVSFVKKLAKSEKFSLEDGVLERVQSGCSTLTTLDGWANGRDVKSLWKDVKGHRAERVYDDDTSSLEKQILVQDMKVAVTAFLIKRRSLPCESQVSKKSKFNMNNLEGHSSDYIPSCPTFGNTDKSYREKIINNSFINRVTSAITSPRLGNFPTAESHYTKQASPDRKPSIGLEEIFIKGIPSDSNNNNVHIDQKSSSIFSEMEGTYERTPTIPNLQDTSKINHCSLDDKLKTSETAISKGIHQHTSKADEISEQVYTHITENTANQYQYFSRDEGVSDNVWEELNLSKDLEDKYTMESNKRNMAYKDFVNKQRANEEEAKKRYEDELDLMECLERDEQERLVKAEEERRHKIEMECLRRDEEEKKYAEKMRKKEEIQKQLQKLNPCPMGFKWFKAGCGWRCGGGSHYVSNETLRKQFTSNL